MNGSALVTEKYIVVAADGGVAGPFVAREGDEPARLIEFRSQRVEVAPECSIYLEIIGLMAGDVEECQVAREIEIVLDGADADGLACLTMQVAPVRCDIAAANDQRSGNGEFLPVLDDLDPENAFFRHL